MGYGIYPTPRFHISINHKSVLPDNNQNAQGCVTTLSGQESNFDSVNVKQGSAQSNSDQALYKILHEVQSLSVRMEKLEHSPPSPQPPPPPSDSQPKCPVFGCPAITALPNDLKIPNLDFSSRHILWTPVVSAGVSLLYCYPWIVVAECLWLVRVI